MSDWLKGKKHFLVLMGRVGCGKTYLCSAVIDWMVDKTDDIYFMREGALLERVKAGFAQEWDWRVQLKYITDHYFFLLDDMGSTRDTEFQKDILTEFIFSRYESGLPTVISTNYNEAQIKQILGERIHSRLFAKENTVIDMFGYPDLRVP
jgi:DNA replication protein DnaC